MNNYNPYNNMYPYGDFNQPMRPTGPTISGKFVTDIKDISANDVPMNGPAGIFVKSDMSEIYSKMWNSDGTITTHVYKMVPDVKENDRLDELTARLDSIEEAVATRLDKVERSIKAKRTSSDE